MNFSLIDLILLMPRGTGDTEGSATVYDIAATFMQMHDCYTLSGHLHKSPVRNVLAEHKSPVKNVLVKHKSPVKNVLDA